MATRRNGGGLFKSLSSLCISILLVGTALFVIGKVSGGTPDGIYGTAKAGAEKVQEWVTGNIDRIDVSDVWNDATKPGNSGSTGNNGNGGASSGSGSADDATTTAGLTKDAATTALTKIAVGEPQKVSYDRTEWKHWIAQGSSCWDTRDEVLYRQGTDIVLLDKDKSVVTKKAKACSVKSGKWVDPYTGTTFTDPAKLDIDHVIPLGYAARQGGQSWNGQKKQDYANSLASGHLLAVSASANRSKSDKGPAAWKPSSAAFQCSYAKDWVSVASTWKLSLPKADVSALKTMLATCK